MTNKHRSVVLGVSEIKFDTHFTIQSVRPLETAILDFEPETKSAGIKYPVKCKGFGQGFKIGDREYPAKDPTKGVCQVTVTTDKGTKRVAYFLVSGRKVDRYIEAVPPKSEMVESGN
jgi:hypothetical protein